MFCIRIHNATCRALLFFSLIYRVEHKSVRCAKWAFNSNILLIKFSFFLLQLFCYTNAHLTNLILDSRLVQLHFCLVARFSLLGTANYSDFSVAAQYFYCLPILFTLMILNVSTPFPTDRKRNLGIETQYFPFRFYFLQTNILHVQIYGRGMSSVLLSSMKVTMKLNWIWKWREFVERMFESETKQRENVY